MILSVICEELGVFGAIMVLLLFGLLLYRLMVIAQNAPDMYGALVASGIFCHIALQVILNVAVVINLIPNTGITLPFISYGGTSILFTWQRWDLPWGSPGRSGWGERIKLFSTADYCAMIYKVVFDTTYNSNR